MRTTTLLLASLLRIIPVPQPDPNALPPVTIDDAAEACNAAGGYWTEHTNASQTATWFECNDPSDAAWDELDQDEKCAEVDGHFDKDGDCVDEEGNVYSDI